MTMRSTTTLSILFVLALLCAPISLAQGQGGGQPEGGAGGAPDQAGAGENANETRAGPPATAREERLRGEEAAQKWQGLSAEKRQMAQQRAENARLFSLFQLEGDNATGRFVSFGIDVATAAVADYAVRTGDNETVFFDRVSLPELTNASDPVVAGAVLRMVGEEAALMAHNAPTAQLRVVAFANGSTVTFDLAEGINVTRDAENRLKLNAADGSHGHILLSGEGNLSVENGLVSATFDRDASVAFLAHPQIKTVKAANLHDQVEALANGRLGATLSLVEVDGEALTESSEYGVQMRAQAVENRRAVIQVSSDNETGRAVVVNLPAEAINATAAEDVTVLLDNATATRAATAAEVLAARNVTAALYHVTQVEGALEVTVAVPHFSERELTITSAEEPTAPTDGGDTTTGGATAGNGDTADGTTTDGTTTDGTTTGGDAPAGDEPVDDEEQPTPGFGVVALVVAVAIGMALTRRRS